MKSNTIPNVRGKGRTGAILILYSAAVMPVIHRFVAEALWQRARLSLTLVTPCGLLMGLCFPVGLRWTTVLKQEENLPWMWALNGAAATLGGFAMVALALRLYLAPKQSAEPVAKRLFGISIVYLFVLFAVLIAERALGVQHFGTPFGRVFA